MTLFERMRQGEFPEGAHVLRAKIDMKSGNVNMRDPVLFRIKYVSHYRVGTQWCVFPMYDFAHALSDAIEGITHSLCTLEFEDHRPLYDWFLDNSKSRYIRSRSNLPSSTQLHCRWKTISAEDGNERYVKGWEDPRMPTLSALRRRGYTPEAIRAFCESVGVAKRENNDLAQLESAVRDDLNRRAPRRMAVLRPLRVVIENYPEDQVEELDAVNNPEDA